MARLWQLVPLHQTVKRAFSLAGFLILGLTTGAAFAADRAGDFDFYVLALTWSPSYCENARRPDPTQCNLDIPGFVVHGLWPQYERGYPEYCASNLPSRLPRSTISGIADVIPSPGAVQYQWQKHGVCAGLRPELYFSTVRRAAQKVVIPGAYRDVHADVYSQARTIEADFVAANPGMSDRGIAVSCDRDGVIEVRICLTKRLDFRRCVEVDRQACRLPKIELPAVD